MVALFPSVNLDKTFHKNKEAWNESSYSNIEKHSDFVNLKSFQHNKTW